MSEEEDEDEDEYELTDEQKAEKILDDENIYMQMLVPGDGLTYPVGVQELVSELLFLGSAANDYR
jgi:hypothetical protein